MFPRACNTRFSRLAISTKKLFRGRQNRRNNWFVLAESGCSAEQKTLDRNSVPKHSAEEKTTRNCVPWNKNRRKHLKFCSKPFRGRETNSEFRSELQWNKNRSNLSEFRSEACIGEKKAVNSVCWSRFFIKQMFFMSFRPVPSFGVDSSVNLGMSTFFSRITESIPILFRGIFSEGNSVANSALAPPPCVKSILYTVQYSIHV